MRPLGALLVVLGIAALAASRFTGIATLDVVLVAVGVVLVLAGVALLLFGRPGRERREESALQRGTDVRPPVRSPMPSEGPAETGDRSLSSPVPLGVGSEPPATSGTGTAAPAPVVPTGELPAPSTASATYEPPMPAAPVLDDGATDQVDRHLAERREPQGPHHPSLEDGEREPR